MQRIPVGGEPEGPSKPKQAGAPTGRSKPKQAGAPTGRSKPKQAGAPTGRSKPKQAGAPTDSARRRRPAGSSGASTSSRRRGSQAPATPSGLDRIRPRRDSSTASLSDERDPLGRAALYSSGSDRQPSALGTFLVECSACHRETPVTAGDLVRLGLPSIHLPIVKRYPSLMRCPACGRRTWVRVRWRL